MTKNLKWILHEAYQTHYASRVDSLSHSPNDFHAFFPLCSNLLPSPPTLSTNELASYVLRDKAPELPMNTTTKSTNLAAPGTKSTLFSAVKILNCSCSTGSNSFMPNWGYHRSKPLFSYHFFHLIRSLPPAYTHCGELISKNKTKCHKSLVSHSSLATDRFLCSTSP